MKKLALIGLVFAMIAGVAGCGTKADTATLRVGATAVPHAEILNFVKPMLLEEGITLDIVVYDDYIQPNLNLRDGEIKANYFQHSPYLERFNQDYNLNLTSVASIHIEPMGIYSEKFTDIAEVTQGTKVLIPGDPTNGGRALALLEKAGLIGLAPGIGVGATPRDIADNPLNLEIVELDAAFIVNAVADAGLAVINTNFAIQVGLIPTEDALVIEDGHSPYANILVVNQGDEEDEAVLILAELLASQAVKEFIQEQYKGQVVPVN